jgi:hypothetical protein
LLQSTAHNNFEHCNALRASQALLLFSKCENELRMLMHGFWRGMQH